MEKLQIIDNLTPQRRPIGAPDTRNISQIDTQSRKSFQPHSPAYPKNEFPDATRKGSQGLPYEYQSQSGGNTPVSPRVKQQRFQSQTTQFPPQQQIPQSSSQQQLVSQQSHRQKNSNNLSQPSQQQNSQQSSQQGRFRPEDVDMRRIEIGLENLGNTCFMNSTLQCLLHIQPLISYFLEGKIENDLNSQSSKKGMLATSFNNLIHDIFFGKTGSSIAPVNFQRAVSNRK
jgi:hypothetical protein